MELQEYLKNKLKSVGMDDVIVGKNYIKSYQVKFANRKIFKTGIEVT